MVDYVGAVEVAASMFFVVLAVVLLVRYKQASARISESSELGHDLWQAMESRLKKQDERILDLMGRVEVLQLRQIQEGTPAQVMRRDVQQSQPARVTTSVPETRAPRRIDKVLDDTERRVVNLIGEGTKSTVDVKEATGLSREHTARLLKSLYERGLAERDDSAKPFVYRLTEKGRSYLG